MISQLLAYFELNWIRLRKQTEFYQPTYNPSNFPLLPMKSVKRESVDRYNFIVTHLDLKKINSVLDIGSQLGYFSLRLSAEEKIFALGIDHDAQAINYSQALQKIYQFPHLAFSHFRLTKDSFNSLPAVDALLFLDVFHHLVWHQGLKDTQYICDKLFTKCQYLVFETGQFNEPDQPWTNSLSFMGSNPSKWIELFLTNHKFKIIAKTAASTHLTSTPRTIYACRRIGN
jgi:cyclopropane fatty-acyl-phospholipid synthase-like methyltransferase